MAETLQDILIKQDSFPKMWKLLAPDDEFRNLYNICKNRWDKMTYRRQQQLYWFIRRKKIRHETLYKNPLYALTYLHPYPVNRNGSAELDDLMAKCKMVSAFFNGSFGIYTALEAEIFEMTHVTPMT